MIPHGNYIQQSARLPEGLLRELLLKDADRGAEPLVLAFNRFTWVYDVTGDEWVGVWYSYWKTL